MRYTRLYADANGTSRFEDIDVPLTDLRSYVPAGGSEKQVDIETIYISAPLQTESMAFVRFPSGWAAGLHPAPRRQFLTYLTGEVEVVDGTGEARRFRPGDVLLVEDTFGTGHISRVIGDADCLTQVTAST